MLKVMKNRESAGFALTAVVGVIALVGILAVSMVSLGNFKGDIRSQAAVLASTATLAIQNSSDIANEDGTEFKTGGSSAWVGTGQSTSSSYLGLRFQGDTVPKGAHIDSAKIEFTPNSTQWIAVKTKISGESSVAPASYGSSSKPSSRGLTSASKDISENSKWEAGKWYSYDVTPVVQELVNSDGRSVIAFVLKGSGGQWGRKFVYTSGANAPKLTISYTSSTETTATSTPVVTASPTVSATPTASPRATASPTVTPTQNPTATPTMTMPPTTGGSGAIFGIVGADTLGACSATVHDKYVVTGPDGKTYRTWHPAKDPSGCTFGHEHGDNPATSNIYTGNSVPFGYIAAQLTPPMDEPHAGFKCFVHNKGTVNDEGRTMQHDAYYCFHMGTGGPARFTARFHSLDSHLKSASGYVMNLQGMADVGNVGTLCDNPRQARTVQGLGCKIDSAYEIWANQLAIRNKGNSVANMIVSTAVFDPITSMDPADKTRIVYSWSPEAQQQIFRFNNPRDNFRGCQREAYTGPASWYNAGGSQVYYTDPYGNIVNGGVLKQEISNINTSANSGYLLFGVGLRMTESSNAQTQFKFRRSACVSGLGIKN